MGFWTSIWKGIETLFVDFLFAPLDAIRFMDNWWLQNTVNWMFVVIGFVAFGYWMKQLKIFEDNNEEDKSSTSHSFL
ncbi:MAG: uracil phosphoribosyltransferase [Flavobacteriaceae bacterium]|jgi:hypothetical protein|nr:uracil phosphoribosyltransferase [Flavobacteriaceae bacterium]NVJ71781.1 uracil phosphoribosyltransferase [Flavobacteriaceae bacterium]